MKRWGLVVVMLYVVALIVLSAPVAFAAFWPTFGWSEIFGMYRNWQFWTWIFVMFSGAVSLLFIPIHYADRRPKSRRPLLVPIVTSILFLGLLGFFFVYSIVLAIWGDGSPPVMSSVNGTSEIAGCAGVWVVVLLLWTLWGILFYRRARSDSPDTLLRRAASWLLKGSILELLVAVSCHVVVRRRDDCCAPLGTFLGIAAGLSVMLLSFGPGVIFLFADRCRQLKPGEVPTKSSTATE